MARFENGWVKIYRKAILGDIGSNYTRLGLFTTLIGIARIQESFVTWRGKPRKLERGELVTSIAELADLGEVDRKTVDRHLNYLVQRGTIILEKSTNGTLIKILNFSKYQDVDAECGKRRPSDMANDMVNGVVNASAQIEELKNLRREEERETRAREEVFEPKTVDELRSAFDDDARKVWRELYPDSEFRKTESLKCFEYWRNDPTRPKTVDGWKQKLGSWFSLGWEKRISPGGASRQSKPPPAAIRELPSEAVLAQSAAMSARLEAEAEPVEIDLEKLPPAMRQLALKVIPGRAG